MTDWKTLAAARGLQLSDSELAKLAAAMEAIEPAYRDITGKLTQDDESAVTLAEEVLGAK